MCHYLCLIHSALPCVIHTTLFTIFLVESIYSPIKNWEHTPKSSAWRKKSGKENYEAVQSVDTNQPNTNTSTKNSYYKNPQTIDNLIKKVVQTKPFHRRRVMAANSDKNRGLHWTNEKHLHFLNSMEASFVQSMLHNNSRFPPLDRYLPDTSDSTHDLDKFKSSTSTFHTGIFIHDNIIMCVYIFYFLFLKEIFVAIKFGFGDLAAWFISWIRWSNSQSSYSCRIFYLINKWCQRRKYLVS